ncbi:MFS transporter [Tessaracoccus terricola]
MSEPGRSRTRLALGALALGGFGVGATEFVAMGVLPQIAQDLLPQLWATSPEDAIARAGVVITAYALGVVLGAATIAAATAKLPRRSLVIAFAVAFTVGSLLSALAPTFELVVLARFLAGLPHGAYFGIASLIAADLMGPGKRGQGVALVMSGLTIANVVGVPVITVVGQQFGWRASYFIVAAVFALATAAIALTVPRQPGNPNATIRAELSAFRQPQVWLALAIGSVGLGGFFAVYSYVAPMVTEVAGLGEGWVSVALVCIGSGMTVGNLIGGRLADSGALRAILVLLPVIAAWLVLLWLIAHSPLLLFVALFGFGAVTSALVPSIQTRLMDVAGRAQTLAAALNHAALNVGNALGAALGGAVIAAQFGYLAPAWVGVALAVLGLLIALVSRSIERRGRA